MLRFVRREGSQGRLPSRGFREPFHHASLYCTQRGIQDAFTAEPVSLLLIGNGRGGWFLQTVTQARRGRARWRYAAASGAMTGICCQRPWRNLAKLVQRAGRHRGRQRCTARVLSGSGRLRWGWRSIRQAANHALPTSAEGLASIETARGTPFRPENRRANWKVESRLVKMGKCCCSERIRAESKSHMSVLTVRSMNRPGMDAGKNRSRGVSTRAVTPCIRQAVLVFPARGWLCPDLGCLRAVPVALVAGPFARNCGAWTARKSTVICPCRSCARSTMRNRTGTICSD